MIPWVIVGAGRLGSALAWLADDLGVEVRAAWSNSRRPDVPAAEIVVGDLRLLDPHLGGAIGWVTVIDSQIARVASELVTGLGPADVVVHASGSLSSRILREAGVAGPVGSIHPLLSVNDPRRAISSLSQCAWTIEGDYAALQFARWFLSSIDVDPFVIDPEVKSLYHASAVASSGLVTALMDVAFELAAGAGFDADEARHLLLPLVRATIDNLDKAETAEALTGPVARGDFETIERHLKSMEGLSSSTREVYEVLTRRARELMD